MLGGDPPCPVGTIVIVELPLNPSGAFIGAMGTATGKFPRATATDAGVSGSDGMALADTCGISHMLTDGIVVAPSPSLMSNCRGADSALWAAWMR